MVTVTRPEQPRDFKICPVSTVCRIFSAARIAVSRSAPGSMMPNSSGPQRKTKSVLPTVLPIVFRNLCPDSISHSVAECVVDELEGIDVGYEEGQRRAVTVSPSGLASKNFVKEETVIGSSQVIRNNGAPL
jgi:hypothetical protein